MDGDPSDWEGRERGRVYFLHQCVLSAQHSTSQRGPPVISYNERGSGEHFHTGVAGSMARVVPRDVGVNSMSLYLQICDR